MESMADYLQLTQRDTIRLLFFELEHALSTEIQLGTPSVYLANVVSEWAEALLEMEYIDEDEYATATQFAIDVWKQFELIPND